MIQSTESQKLDAILDAPRFATDLNLAGEKVAHTYPMVGELEGRVIVFTPPEDAPSFAQKVYAEVYCHTWESHGYDGPIVWEEVFEGEGEIPAKVERARKWLNATMPHFHLIARAAK
jgi:hypothetical protein